MPNINPFLTPMPSHAVMHVLQTVLVTTASLGPLAVALATTLAPPPGGPVAALFPPWWNAGHVITEAWTAGPVIRQGAVPFIVIVAAPNRARLHASGAWLLLNPGAAGGCLPNAS